ncbi:MAG: hypothetical protein ACRC6O_07555 [Flavobacterium sp.]
MRKKNHIWKALMSFDKYGIWLKFGNASEGNILLKDHEDIVWFRSIAMREL